MSHDDEPQHEYQAEREEDCAGLSDMQIDTLAGDLRDLMLMKFRDVNCAWSAMSEDKQREVAGAMDLAANDLVRSAVRLLTKHDFPRCVVQLGEIKIVGGDKSRIEGKIAASNISENREVLGDHVNTLVQLVCVDSETFMGERGPAKVDPDQPQLPVDQDEESTDPEATAIPSAMLRQARDAMLKEGVASTSFIQRRLAIGYNKAARIIEMLEAEGFVSAPDESGKRSILSRGDDDPEKS